MFWRGSRGSPEAAPWVIASSAEDSLPQKQQNCERARGIFRSFARGSPAATGDLEPCRRASFLNARGVSRPDEASVCGR